MVVLHLLWFMFGFSLVYGPDHSGVIGDASFFFYKDLGARRLALSPP
jgi:ammonia channel protein AmtB